MGVLLMLVGLLGFLFGAINVIYPLRRLRMTSRKMALGVLGASFVAFMIGGSLLPPPDQAREPAPPAPVAQTPPPAPAPAPQAPAAERPAPEPDSPTPLATPPTPPAPAPTEPAAPPSPPTTKTVPVVGVTDGDTIKVSIGGKTETVRLIGVDTPETVHPSKPVEPYGPEASAYTKRRLSGQQVRLEFDVEERDHYGRLLAYVWLGEEMFNAALVKDGYGQVLTIPPNVKYADLFVALQREARENDRGLWGLNPASPTPVPTPTPTPTPGSSVYYKNCIAVREAGAAPIRRGEPGYGSHLDRDNDGIACE